MGGQSVMSTPIFDELLREMAGAAEKANAEPQAAVPGQEAQGEPAGRRRHRSE